MEIPEILLKPSEDQISSILEKHLLDKDRKINEVEIRLGKLINKITKKRVNFPTQHPIIFDYTPSEFEFKGGVDKNDFVYIKNKLFNKIMEDTDLEIQHKTRSKDLVSVSKQSIRKIEGLDDDNNVISTKYEKKTRIKNITIYLPNYIYDVRLSFSVETASSEEAFKKLGVTVKRNRSRESFALKNYSFDFTKVRQPKSLSKNEEEPIYEIELEITSDKYRIKEFVQMIFNLPIIKG